MFVIFRKASDADKKGRTSGSLAWRLERGEVDDQHSPFTWILDETVEPDSVNIKYSATRDYYEISYSKKNEDFFNKVQGWKSGVFATAGIFRKEEKDWKMAYLCRKGKICNTLRSCIHSVLP